MRDSPEGYIARQFAGRGSRVHSVFEERTRFVLHLFALAIIRSARGRTVLDTVPAASEAD